MTNDLQWLISTTASALYTARLLWLGRTLVDDKWRQALASEVDALLATLVNLGVSPERFFEHAIPSTARFDAIDRLAEAVAAKTLGPAAATEARPSLARQMIALVQAFGTASPDALAELELRGAPLREQWEARGPGLLAALARRTEPELLVDTASIVLVMPVSGGGGLAHPGYNAVTFEAVLANPLAELPEVVRLGWLVGQLTLDMPRFEDRLPRELLAVVGPLALAPAVLAAAEEVELARFDRATLATALVAWTAAPIEPEVLVDWWQTYENSRPDWIVAVGALAEMLGGEPAMSNDRP